MPIQIINDPNRSVGASVGQSLGSGLGTALNYLAQKKLAQIEERQRKSEQETLYKNAGYSPEQASLLSSFANNPAEQLKLFQMLGAVAPQQQQQAEPTYFQQQPGIQDYQEQMPQQPAAFRQGLEQLMQGPQNQGIQAQQDIAQRLGLPELPTSQYARQLSQALQQGQLQPELVQQQARPMAQPMIAPQQQMQPIAQPQQQAPKTIAQTLGAYENPQDRRARLKMEQQERQFQEKEARERQKEAFKETKTLREEINKAAKSAKQDLKDLERFEELEKSGNLDTPGYVEFLKRSGLDIPALMSPESEEFQKIAANFLRDAKTYFGGRISNYEVEQYLKTIPSLSQSPEGRKRVIANLKYLKRSALEYNEALKEVIKENKGIPPLDLADKIDDRIDKRLDVLSERFKRDLAKPVPQGQNRYITGLQTAVGSILGAPGALIKGAAKAAPAISALV